MIAGRDNISLAASNTAVEVAHAIRDEAEVVFVGR